MDIERTMEFILAQQAKTDASLAEIAASQAEISVSQAKMEKQQARAEKQLLAMRKVVWAGIRLVGDIGQRQTALDEKMKETAEQMKLLAESQRETDAKFKQLMEVLLKQNKNGH